MSPLSGLVSECGRWDYPDQRRGEDSLCGRQKRERDRDRESERYIKSMKVREIRKRNVCEKRKEKRKKKP